MVESNITDAVFALAAFFIRRPDPEPCIAIRPADGILVFIRYSEAEKIEQPAVERLGLLVIANPDDEMVDSHDTYHMALSCQAAMRRTP